MPPLTLSFLFEMHVVCLGVDFQLCEFNAMPVIRDVALDSGFLLVFCWIW